MSAFPIDIAPSVADAAALLRARTKDVNGEEIGTFNDDTRPTSAQVLTLIDEAVADIQARMGPTPPEGLAAAGRSAAAMLTACLIELKRVRIHDLRHSYCTMAVRAYRLDEVKAYAGHVDIATTQRYVHHIPQHDAADRLSALVAAAVHPDVHRTGVMHPNSAQLSNTESTL